MSKAIRTVLLIIPTSIRDKIDKDEFNIHFATLLPEVMFGTSNPFSQQSD